MLSEQDKDLIERGILDDLTVEEQIQFQSKLDSQKEFREAVELQRRMLASLEAEKKVALKNELKTIFARIEPEESGRGSVRKKWYWLAASLIAVLMTVGWLSLRTNYTGIFDEYFDPYPAENMVRGEASGGDIREVFRLYGGRDYQQVVALINSQIASGVQFSGQNLYLGNALLATDRTGEAIQVLSQIGEENRYYTDAQWYLALGYLKNREKAEAREVLNSILNKRSFYQSSVRELLKAID